jgi:hypothetical protein
MGRRERNALSKRNKLLIRKRTLLDNGPTASIINNELTYQTKTLTGTSNHRTRHRERGSLG